MSPVWWAFATALVLGYGLGVFHMYMAPVVSDWRAERRLRRARSKRVQTISSREVAKLARMRQDLADEVAAQRAKKRGRK